jgi:enterochelin esterase-like enzyme
VPAIANALIKHGRMLPTVIAMVQSGQQAERDREYTANEQHYAFLLSELLPMIQTHYFIDPTRVAVGGVAVGAVAAAHAALRNPVVFSRLIMISPPLGKGANQDKLNALKVQFAESETVPRRIFHSVGRYEAKARFLRPSHALREALAPRRDTGYRFIETGSGHGLVGFKSVLPEALAWTFPGIAEA